MRTSERDPRLSLPLHLTTFSSSLLSFPFRNFTVCCSSFLLSCWFRFPSLLFLIVVLHFSTHFLFFFLHSSLLLLLFFLNFSAFFFYFRCLLLLFNFLLLWPFSCFSPHVLLTGINLFCCFCLIPHSLFLSLFYFTLFSVSSCYFLSFLIFLFFLSFWLLFLLLFPNFLLLFLHSLSLLFFSLLVVVSFVTNWHIPELSSFVRRSNSNYWRVSVSCLFFCSCYLFSFISFSSFHCGCCCYSDCSLPRCHYYCCSTLLVYSTAVSSSRSPLRSSSWTAAESGTVDRGFQFAAINVIITKSSIYIIFV